MIKSRAAPLRVLTSDDATDYHRLIYDRLAGFVIDRGLNRIAGWNGGHLGSVLHDVEVFHLHWPEWLLGPNIEEHRSFVDALHRAEVSIVWSQHNIRPHSDRSEWRAIYQLWAHAADGVIHHSKWGKDTALAVQRYRRSCRHLVAYHPHFGPMLASHEPRSEIEARLGWRRDVLRLVIVGSPRPGKKVVDAMTAFSRCRRSDVELRIFSLAESDRIPDDRRVFAERYTRVDRTTYDRRLAASDALIMPYHHTPMLTTGTVADAIAHGLPCLVSEWPFLPETLGDAAIVYGSSPSDLVEFLNRLDQPTLARAAAAARTLQGPLSAHRIAHTVYDFLQEIRRAKKPQAVQTEPDRHAAEVATG